MKNKTHIEDLIVKYLDQTASELELSQIKDWRAESPENEKVFQETIKLWGEAGELGKWQRIEVESALSDLINTSHKSKKASIVSRLKPMMGWKVAAAIVAALLIFKILTPTGSGELKTDYLAHQDTIFQLPDGSAVHMKKNSQFTIAEFDLSQRRVSMLRGTALFDVIHSQESPFIVHSERATVRVLGTVFEIEERSDTTTIKVERGKVIVELPLDKSSYQILEAGDSSLIVGEVFVTVEKEIVTSGEVHADSPVDHPPIKRIPETKQERSLQFRNTLIKEVISDINRLHNDVLILDKKLSLNCRIDADFTETDVNTMVESIKSVCGLKSRKRGDKIMLYR